MAWGEDGGRGRRGSSSDGAARAAVSLAVPLIYLVRRWADRGLMRFRRADLTRSLGGEALPLPCISAAFVAKIAPLPCVSIDFMAKTLPFLAVLRRRLAGQPASRDRCAVFGKTLPLPCVSNAFVTKTLPLPCASNAFVSGNKRICLVVPLPSCRLKHCLCLAVHPQAPRRLAEWLGAASARGQLYVIGGVTHMLGPGIQLLTPFHRRRM